MAAEDIGKCPVCNKYGELNTGCTHCSNGFEFDGPSFKRMLEEEAAEFQRTIHFYVTDDWKWSVFEYVYEDDTMGDELTRLFWCVREFQGLNLEPNFQEYLAIRRQFMRDAMITTVRELVLRNQELIGMTDDDEVWTITEEEHSLIMLVAVEWLLDTAQTWMGRPRGN